MAKGRNSRKTRKSTLSDIDFKKVAIVLGAILILILLIFVIINISKSTRNKKIENVSKVNYEYFVFYDLNNNAGVIDKQAKEIIKPKYAEIYIPNPEESVFFCYDENDNYKVLNERSEEVFSEYEEVSALRTSDDMIINFIHNTPQ